MRIHNTGSNSTDFIKLPNDPKGNGHHFCILTVNNLRKLSGKCAAMAAMRASRDTTSTLLCVSSSLLLASSVGGQADVTNILSSWFLCQKYKTKINYRLYSYDIFPRIKVVDIVSKDKWLLMLFSAAIKIFWRAGVCRPLLCLCRPLMIFKGCLDSNPECCRSKLVRYRLNQPSNLYEVTQMTWSGAVLFI